MPRLSAEQRLGHRQRIVDAAWRCVARTGVGDFRVEDICADAGVSKGSFYLYFERKEDILFALLDQDATELEHRVTRVMASERPGIDRLRHLAQTMLSDNGQQARLQVRVELWALGISHPILRRRFAARLKTRRSLLSTALTEGIDGGGYATGSVAEPLARIVLAIMDGLMLQAAAEDRAMKWAPVRDAIDAVLEGLRRTEGTPT